MKTEEPNMQPEYDFSQAKQGPLRPTSPTKTRITIRIDTDILNWFRENVNTRGGGSYQALINQALREHIESQELDLETTLRRIVREEIHLANVTK